MSVSLDDIAKHVDRQDGKISSLEKKIEQVQQEALARAPTPSKSTVQPHEEASTSSSIRSFVREEAERHARSNNIIINGMEEGPGEDLSAIVRGLCEDLAPNDILDVMRVGKATETKRRLVKVVLTPHGKRALYAVRNATYNSKPIYVQHDLTRDERERRKKWVPLYKDLRKQQIKCSLPRDCILMDGLPLTESSGRALLEDARSQQQPAGHA